MTVQVTDVLLVVVMATKSNVAVFEPVNSQRIPRGYYDPYSDIELPIHDEHRILDVLLYYPSLSLLGSSEVSVRCYLSVWQCWR